MRSLVHAEPVRNKKFRLFIYLILIVVYQCTLVSSLHAQVAYYISPSGNDSWTGLNDTNQNGDGPFATLNAAVEMVRKQSVVPGSGKDYRIILRTGTYPVFNPIKFTEGDKFSLSVEAYKGEKPVISAGKKITGWKRSKVNGRVCWKVNLPEVKSGDYYFWQLFVGGNRAIRPRVPETGFFEVENPLLGASENVGDQLKDAARDRFVFKEGDIKPWKNLQDINAMIVHYWQEDYLPVKEVNWEKREVIFTAKSYMAFVRSHPYHVCGNAWYYMDNVFEALDSPGEWYLDKPSGDLYYIPRAGEIINQTEIYAPVAVQVIQVTGNSGKDKLAGNLHLTGLDFRHNAIVWNSHYGTGNGFGGSGPAMINFSGAEDCSVSECIFTNLGEYGVEISGGSQRVYIVGNHFSDMGAGAVKIASSSGIYITDNEIHTGGRIFHGAVAVLAGNTKYCRFLHNHISDFYYNGIVCSANRNTPGCYDNLIMKNHIHDIGQGWLSDMGGIYVPGLQPGMVISGNVIHDINAACYGGNAVYLDDFAQHIIIEQNLLYNTNKNIINMKGTENIIRNNILAFGNKSIIRRASTRVEDTMVALVYKNIMIVNNTAVHRTRDEISIFKPGYWSDLNLVWNVGKDELKVEWPFGFGKPSATADFDEWISKTGNDRNSTIQDPLLKDPLNGDFRIGPNSIIHKLHIDPGTFDDVGPRSSEKWELTQVKKTSREASKIGHIE